MIDWAFIGEMEGASLKGYVPSDDARDNSGVTIASGVDLSSWGAVELSALPPLLATKLRFYTGLRGPMARGALRARSLEITADEAVSLNVLARRESVALLTRLFDRDALLKFEQIPDRAQTVVASVAFQYGSIDNDCPRFWRCVTHFDWSAAYSELLNFGDGFAPRRKREAAYLLPLVKNIV